ncbi:hypothetical protein JW992_11585 [candidate division KSB1 bacterium]|nr:hypothetical protein [candidate division KSB1 bacterium]
MKLFLLFAAYGLLLLLSRVLYRRIARYSGDRRSRWIFVFIAVMALYYFIDAWIIAGLRPDNAFLWLWFGVFTTEWLFFFIAGKPPLRNSRHD